MFLAVIGQWGESWFLMLCFRDSMRNVMLESGEMMFCLFFYSVKSPYLYSKNVVLRSLRNRAIRLHSASLSEFNLTIRSNTNPCFIFLRTDIRTAENGWYTGSLFTSSLQPIRARYFTSLIRETYPPPPPLEGLGQNFEAKVTGYLGEDSEKRHDDMPRKD